MTPYYTLYMTLRIGKRLLFNIPKHHWSDAPLVRRIIDPTTHWSEAPLVRRNKISFNEDYKVIT